MSPRQGSRIVVQFSNRSHPSSLQARLHAFPFVHCLQVVLPATGSTTQMPLADLNVTNYVISTDISDLVGRTWQHALGTTLTAVSLPGSRPEIAVTPDGRCHLYATEEDYAKLGFSGRKVSGKEGGWGLVLLGDARHRRWSNGIRPNPLLI